MKKVDHRPNRWLLWGPLAAGGFLFALYGLAWNEAASKMRRSVEVLAETQRPHGVSLAYESLNVTGFPFLLRGAVTKVSVAAQDEWEWRTQALSIDAAPLLADRFVVSTDKPQRLDLGELGVWLLEADDARASIGEHKEREWVADIESARATLHPETNDGPVIKAGKFLMTVAPDAVDRERIETSLVANGVTATGRTRTISAPIIEIALAVTQSEALQASSEPLQNWRAANGEILLRRIAIEAEGGVLYLAGALSLDEEGFPEGALKTEITNPAVFALALSELGAIDPNESETIAAALTLASMASGGKLTAPLVFKAGYATIAGVRIAKLPQVK